MANQAFLGINYTGYRGFVEARDLLLSFFDGSLDRTIEVIDALNFEDDVQAHIVSYIPDIVEQMGSLDDQLAFIAHMQEIQAQHPEVDFGSAFFYAQLKLNFDSSSPSKNSTDDGPPNKEVYFGGSL